MAEINDPYSDGGAGTATLALLEGATRYNRWLVSKLAPFLGDINLELGAGHGTLTAIIAEERGVIATEPSEAGRRAMLQRFAGNPAVQAIHVSTADLDLSESVDAVYSANVLEHVPDDAALIREAARVLKPNGYFVAIVPWGPLLYSRFDAAVGHYRRYGRADRVRLTEMVRCADLVPVTFTPFNPIGALAWFYRMRLLGCPEIRPSDVLSLERLVPWLRIFDKLRLPFGQNLLFAFRKIERAPAHSDKTCSLVQQLAPTPRRSASFSGTRSSYSPQVETDRDSSTPPK